MSTQGRNELNQFDPNRARTSGRRPATNADSVPKAVVETASPQVDDAGRGESLFSILTILILVALAACGAAAVAATYGPVFTQSAIGP